MYKKIILSIILSLSILDISYAYAYSVPKLSGSKERKKIRDQRKEQKRIQKEARINKYNGTNQRADFNLKTENISHNVQIKQQPEYNYQNNTQNYKEYTKTPVQNEKIQQAEIKIFSPEDIDKILNVDIKNNKFDSLPESQKNDIISRVYIRD
ncbi:MAG: hypothetical protein MJ247_00145 [Alphaproteobacteria bacterium]|nr:hypothetical protein [Alphaproteobacteria bacterium]